MNRRSVIRCILGLAAAPKIMAEIDFKPLVPITPGITTSLFNQFNFVVPEYMPKLLEKYGHDNYMLAMEVLGNETVDKNTYHHYETNEGRNNIKG